MPDPFIEVFAQDYTFRWRCSSCDHVDDTAWITSEDARRAGEEHSCLDQLGGPAPAPAVTPDLDRPWPICWAEHHGMLCDRQRGHVGDHVDTYGPLPQHTWTDEEALAPRPGLSADRPHEGQDCRADTLTGPRRGLPA